MSTARDELSFDITVTLKTVISLYNHVGIVCDTSVGSFLHRKEMLQLLVNSQMH